MPPRRKAKDFFSPEPGTEAAVAEASSAKGQIESGRLRRSARLSSSHSVEPSSPPKARPKSVLEMGRDAKMAIAQVATSVSSPPKKRVVSGGSQSTDDDFVDAREEELQTVIRKADPSAEIKSPVTDELYLSAAEDVEDTSAADISFSSIIRVHGSSKHSTPHPETTQNTLENIPSSQPRPRSEHTPLPLEPVHSPPPSFTTSTSLSQLKSTQESTDPAPHPRTEGADNGGENSEQDLSEDDSDDEAPEAISLSLSRSKALLHQSQISQQSKVQTEKEREKRRRQDRLFITQKQEKRAREQQTDEVPNSQQSYTDINSGNTTDTPAPNQDHQAARIARHAQALPAEILQAASATWFEDSENTTVAAPVRHKKRKERDDGIRILEEMNVRITPKVAPMSQEKEKLIMRMGGRGERRMYIGRFGR